MQQFDHSNNLFCDCTSGFTLGPGEIIGNPLFFDDIFQNGEFSVRAESPVIDAGVNVGLPFNGRAPDIGIRESGFHCYYVSPHCDDNNSGTSPGSAWKSIDNGDYTNALVPGDVVVLLEGTYNVSTGSRYANQGVQLSSSSNGVSYIAQGNAIVDRGSGYNGGWFINPGSSGIVLDGITFQGGEQCLWVWTASNIEIKNCKFLDGNVGTNMWWNAAVNLVHGSGGCLFHDNVIVGNDVYRAGLTNVERYQTGRESAEINGKSVIDKYRCQKSEILGECQLEKYNFKRNNIGQYGSGCNGKDI